MRRPTTPIGRMTDRRSSPRLMFLCYSSSSQYCRAILMIHSCPLSLTGLPPWASQTGMVWYLQLRAFISSIGTTSPFHLGGIFRPSTYGTPSWRSYSSRTSLAIFSHSHIKRTYCMLRSSSHRSHSLGLLFQSRFLHNLKLYLQLSW